MVGRASDGTRYISHEKNNYGQRAKTILFDIEENGRVRFIDTTNKTDADFVTEAYKEARTAPVLDATKNMILSYLQERQGEKIEINALDNDMLQAGVRRHTLQDAKNELKQERKVKLEKTGGQGGKWLISLTHYENE